MFGKSQINIWAAEFVTITDDLDPVKCITLAETKPQLRNISRRRVGNDKR